MGPEAGAGDDVIGIGRHPGRRQVAFDAAPGIQHLGVGETALGNSYVVGGDPGERRLRILALKRELGKRTLVEERHAPPHRFVLPAHLVEPVLAAESVAVHRLIARSREPVGPLPPHFLAEAGARLAEPPVKG